MAITYDSAAFGLGVYRITGVQQLSRYRRSRCSNSPTVHGYSSSKDYVTVFPRKARMVGSCIQCHVPVFKQKGIFCKLESQSRSV